MQQHQLHSDRLKVTIDAQGAEMHSLCGADGAEYLWQADPAIWARHAPHLFPIVGRLVGDELRHADHSYPMGQHGFARNLPFVFEHHTAQTCRLVLHSDDETRTHYPFDFKLAVEYSLQGNTLSISYAVQNTGASEMPCSVGAHPAFNWPQPGNPDRGAYRILFDQDETAPVSRLANGLIADDQVDNPVIGKVLQLKDELFIADAIIFTRHNSRRVQLVAEGAKTITVDFADFPHLGIWSIPGAGFICIEPWQGYADAEGFTGDFMDKPGVVILQAGETRFWEMRIRVGD